MFGVRGGRARARCASAPGTRRRRGPIPSRGSAPSARSSASTKGRPLRRPLCRLRSATERGLPSNRSTAAGRFACIASHDALSLRFATERGGVVFNRSSVARALARLRNQRIALRAVTSLCPKRNAFSIAASLNVSTLRAASRCLADRADRSRHARIACPRARTNAAGFLEPDAHP